MRTRSTTSALLFNGAVALMAVAAFFLTAAPSRAEEIPASSAASILLGGNSSADLGTGIHASTQTDGGANAFAGNTIPRTCGTTATGGSIANILSGALGALGGGGNIAGTLGNLGSQSLITCINAGQCPNQLGDPSFTSALGSAFSILQGGDVGQTIVNLGIQNAPRILQALGFGGGGAQGGAGAVGSALHLGGANPIGSLLGGGGAVPTNETNKNLLGDVQSTRKSSNALEVKELCTDTIAYNLAQQTGDSLHAETRKLLTTGNAGEPFQVTNYQELYDRVAGSVTNDYVKELTETLPDSKIGNTVAEWIANDYTADKNPATAFQNCDGPENESSLLRVKRLLVDKPGCTTQGAYVTATNILFDKRAGAQGAIEQVVSDGQGTLPKVTALVDGVETPVHIADNPEKYTIVVPGANLAEQSFLIDAAGAERLQQVSETGQVVNQFMVQLFQQALTNVRGLLSLSEKGSGSLPQRPGGTGSGFGTEGGGGQTGAGNLQDDANISYLDQIANTSLDTSVGSGRSILTQGISAAIATEEAYQNTLAAMVGDIAAAGGAFDQVRQCYVGLTKRVVTGISTATALERANQASTTVATIFRPQIERRLTEIDDSELVVGELVRLGGLARDAEDANELNAVSDSFDALLSSGLVHSATDLEFLENDRAAAFVALSAVSDEAFAQLSECRQF